MSENVDNPSLKGRPFDCSMGPNFLSSLRTTQIHEIARYSKRQQTSHMSTLQ